MESFNNWEIVWWALLLLAVAGGLITIGKHQDW